MTSSAAPADLLAEVGRPAGPGGGATVREQSCDDRGARPSPTGAGAGLHLAAGGDTTGSSAYADVADASPEPGAPPGEWSALGVQPAHRPGIVRCEEEADGGCAVYRGPLAVPAARDEAVTAPRGPLARAGYHVEGMSCAHDGGVCVLGPVRSAAGRDPVTVTAEGAEVGRGASVTLDVASHRASDPGCSTRTPRARPAP